MFKHKKLLSILLAAVMLFSLTACGGGGDTSTGGEEPSGDGAESTLTAWEETANIYATNETDEEL